MFSSDTLPFILLFSVLCVAIVASHAVSAFCGERLRRVFTPIGIVLHILALALFLFSVNSKGSAFELDIVILFFASSILVYTALFFIAQKIAQKRAAVNEEVEA